MDSENKPSSTPPSPAPAITSSLRTIRTLKGDVEANVASGKATVVSIAAAETERRSREAATFEERAAAPLRRARMLAVFLFILGGAFLAGSAGVYLLRAPAEETRGLIEPPDFIFAEQRRLLNIGGLGSDQIIAELARARQETAGQLGSVNAIVPIETLGGAPQAIAAADFLVRLDPETPKEAVRTLGREFLLGVHVFDGNQSFLILKPDTYETAFAGMLAWESTLPFRVGRALRPAADWLSASSTLLHVEWRDAVIANKDARVLRSTEGKMLLLYSFTDRNTLVIATNEQAFGEVLRRIAVVRATP